MKVKIVNKTENENPHYATSGSAGMDLRSNEESFVLFPGERIVVGTGLNIEIPEGVEAQVRPRSGLAIKHGITVLNSPGTIDSDFRGEVGVILINLGKTEFTINKGDKIAQLVFAKHEHISWDNVDALSYTDRGEGGFGSTGTK